MSNEISRRLTILALALFGASARADLDCASLLGEERAAALLASSREGARIQIFTTRVNGRDKFVALVGDEEPASKIHSPMGSALRRAFGRVGLALPRPAPPRLLERARRTGWLKARLMFTRWRGRPLDRELTEYDASRLPLFADRPPAPAALADDDLFDLFAERPVGWLERLLTRASLAPVGVLGFVGLTLLGSYESFGHLLGHVETVAHLPLFAALFPTVAPYPRANVAALLENLNTALGETEASAVAAIVTTRDWTRVANALRGAGFEVLRPEPAPAPSTSPGATVPLESIALPARADFPAEFRVSDAMLDFARTSPESTDLLATMALILRHADLAAFDRLSLALNDGRVEDESREHAQILAAAFPQFSAPTIARLGGWLNIPSEKVPARTEATARIAVVRRLLAEERFRRPLLEFVTRASIDPRTETRFAGVLARSEAKSDADVAFARDRLGRLRAALERTAPPWSLTEIRDLTNFIEMLGFSRALGSEFYVARVTSRYRETSLPLEAYRRSLRSRSGRSLIGQHDVDHLAVALRVIAGEGLYPPDPAALFASLRKSLHAELMPLKVAVSRRPQPVVPVTIPAREGSRIIDPKDFAPPPPTRSRNKRIRRPVEAPESPPVAEATPADIIPPELDLARLDPLTLQKDVIYQFHYNNKPHVARQRVRFGSDAIDWIKQNSKLAPQVITDLQVGQGPNSEPGIKKLSAYRSRYYKGSLYEIKMFKPWRPLLILVDGVWQLIVVAPKAKQKRFCESLRPLDSPPEP